MPTFNRLEVLLSSMRAVGRLERPWPCELVVVVDGSDDGSAEAARALDIPLPTIVLTQPNAGAAAARNAGAAAAAGTLLLFLDDDMEADPRLLVEHDRLHEGDADVVVGHMPMHPLSPSSVLTPGIRRWVEQRAGRLRRPGAAMDLGDLLSGQLSMSAALFAAVGGFDPGITAGGTFGGEDTDLFYRLRQRGVRVAAAPGAISHQRYVVTPQQYLRQWQQGGRADAKLVQKHPGLGNHLLRQHGADHLGGRLIIAASRHHPTLWSWATRWVLARTAQGRTDGATQLALRAVRDAGYWSGGREVAGPGWPHRQVRVLAYHGVEDTDDPIAGDYCVSAARLRAHLAALREHGWHVITAEQFLARHVSPPPPRSVLITFDDGYQSVADAAAPVLEEFGVSAAVLLVTQQLGGRNEWDIRRGAAPRPLLGQVTLRQLQQQGWYLGAHTRTHRHLASLDLATRELEISGPVADLQAAGLGRPRLLAYPYGEHSGSIRWMARRAGYQTAFALADGAGWGRGQAYPRIEVRRNTTADDLLDQLQQPARGSARRQLQHELRALLRGRHPRPEPEA